MTWCIVNHEGKMALTMDWDASWLKPEFYRLLFVFERTEYDERLQDFKFIAHPAEGVLVFWDPVSRKNFEFHTDGATLVTERKPYPSPGKGSKNFEWRYKEGRWRKFYY